MEDDDGGFPLTIPYHYDGEETEREMVAEGDMPDVDEQGDEDEDNEEGKMIIKFFLFFSLCSLSLSMKLNKINFLTPCFLFVDAFFLFFYFFVFYM